MAISQEEIKALAKLAKLSFDDERCKEFAGEFEEIINFADAVNSTIGGGTENIREVGGKEIDFSSLRADETGESLPAEKITSNVRSEGGYFPVRRVVK